MEFEHYSVLLEETIEQLHIKPEGIYVDGTLGGGGHALEEDISMESTRTERPLPRRENACGLLRTRPLSCGIITVI